jgi:hypothetical protein
MIALDAVPPLALDFMLPGIITGGSLLTVA